MLRTLATLADHWIRCHYCGEPLYAGRDRCIKCLRPWTPAL